MTDAKELTRRSRKSKAKGYNGEKEIESLFKSCGVPVSRDGRSHRRDVYINMDTPLEKVVEVKRRKSGFKEITKWLVGADVLCMREDHGEWIVAMIMDQYLEYLTIAGQRKPLDFSPELPQDA